MRKANPYRRMAKALQTNSRASNILDRHFDGNQPRTTLCTDITYIPYFDKNHEKQFCTSPQFLMLQQKKF